MEKVVINGCYGGFGLSDRAIMRYGEIREFKLYLHEDEYGWKHYSKDKNDSEESYFSYYDIERTDPALIQVIEEIGKEADGDHAELKIVKIPDGVEWEIEEYDGLEWIAEKHRTWS